MPTWVAKKNKNILTTKATSARPRLSDCVTIIFIRNCTIYSAISNENTLHVVLKF